MTDKPFTLPIGATAPNFNLKGTDGKFYSLNDFAREKVLVIFFTCNHCPYVINSDETTRQTVQKYTNKSIIFVGINSNCEKTYPEDSYEHMIQRMETHHFPWHYLRDDKQETALAYGALRTPHFFVFDVNRHLIYTGRAIDSPRDPSKMTVKDLENAIEDYLHGRPVKIPLTNPIGCNIKWDGKEKHWMPPEACNLV